LQLKDHDYLKLQFLGPRGAWLGCPGIDCGLQTCPSLNGNYSYFDAQCWREEFQIIGDGDFYNPIRSGQQVRLRYVREHNTWLGCPFYNHCDKRLCSGTIAQAGDFRNNRCWGEIFKIYARGRKNGDVIYNGDVVMLYYVRDGGYISIQGESAGSVTSLNFCPGIPPPEYFSYGICSNNTFRIYRKP